MDKTEIIFLLGAVIILIALLCLMPEAGSLIGILVVLVIIIALMAFLVRYRKKYENRKISMIFTVIGVILFVILFVNSAYTDFTNNKPVIDGLSVVILFIISMGIGWFFEENKN